MQISEGTQEGFYTHMLSDASELFQRLSFQKHWK